MREQRKLTALSGLAAVQKARRMVAEGAMGAAASAEEKARREEEIAGGRCDEAAREWAAHVASAGFCPQYSLSLAGRMMVRDKERIDCSGATRAAADLHERRRLEWQILEAQVRNGERAINRLGRKVARKEDEKRSAEAADRSTQRWRLS